MARPTARPPVRLAAPHATSRPWSLRVWLCALLAACSAEVPPPEPSPASAPVAAAPAPAADATPAPADRRVEARPRYPGPRLRFDDLSWDWGVTPAGRELRHLFTLHNDGDAPVLIRKVRATCNCTAASFDREIAPGGDGTMEVVVNGMKLHHGRSTVYLDIVTNDARSDTTLILRGEVVPADRAGAVEVDGGLLVR